MVWTGDLAENEGVAYLIRFAIYDSMQCMSITPLAIEEQDRCNGKVNSKIMMLDHLTDRDFTVTQMARFYEH